MEIKKSDKNVIKIVFLVGIMLLVVQNFNGIISYLTKFMSVFSTVILGFFIAYFLNILVRLIECKILPKPKTEKVKGIYRSLSIVASFLILVIIFAILFNLVVPELIKAINTFIKVIPDAVKRITEFANKYSKQIPALDNYLKSKPDLSSSIINNIDSIVSYLSTNGVSFIGSLFGKVTSLVMGLIISIYVLYDKEGLKNKVRRLINRYLGEKTEEKFYHVASIANETLRSYLIGQSLEAIIIGVLCTVGLYLFGFPYAVMIGVVIGFSALIPILGAYIGGVFGFFMILSKNTTQAMLFIVFLLVLQQIEDNLIYPRVVGGSVGLPSIWVIISIVIAAGLFGIIGIFLSVPIAATIYKIITEDVRNFEKYHPHD